jgi:hypothetical protein
MSALHNKTIPQLIYMVENGLIQLQEIPSASRAAVEGYFAEQAAKTAAEMEKKYAEELQKPEEKNVKAKQTIRKKAKN